MTKQASTKYKKNAKGPARDLIDSLEKRIQRDSTTSSSDILYLKNAIKTGKIGSFDLTSPYSSFLFPLLDALNWRGNTRNIFEALPHFAENLDLTEFRNTLARLGYKTTRSSSRISEIDARLFPCLFVDNKDQPMLILSREKAGIEIYDSINKCKKILEDSSLIGTAYFISSQKASQTNKKAQTGPEKNWVGGLFLRFKSTIIQLFSMTLILNIFALLVPLFIMSIYDQVIPSKSAGTLVYLAGGMGFAIICEILLRMSRSKFIAYLGSRVENIIMCSTFGKLLSLPPSMTESSPLGAQVSRLKEFDAIKGLFSGTLVNIVFELPFMVIFLAIIAILGGSLAYIPIAMMGIFGLIAFIMMPSMKQTVSSSGRHKAERHAFLVESMSNLRTIKQTASEQTWLERFRSLSADAAYSHFRTSQVSLLLQSLAQAIMMGAGVATVGFGVLKILAGDMTVGALIACMVLVWRVLSPLQGLFLTLTRLEQTLNSIRQINLLMKISAEDDPGPSHIAQQNFSGHIIMDRVSFRYRPSSEPALLGVSFNVKPGEMLSIVGPNASGKSTILKLLLAMNRPQAGQIILDGMDIRQINPITLRRAIAYVPQEAHFFHGTIAQNLRFVQPMASDDDLIEACRMAHVLADIRNLDFGFETRIGDQLIQNLPSSFRQRLSLARAYLKKAPVILLDEPAKTLDFEGDKAFIKSLNSIKGTATIFMISHRPSHIKMADKVLVMDSGMVQKFGTPEEVFPRITEKEHQKNSAQVKK